MRQPCESMGSEGKGSEAEIRGAYSDRIGGRNNTPRSLQGALLPLEVSRPVDDDSRSDGCGECGRGRELMTMSGPRCRQLSAAGVLVLSPTQKKAGLDLSQLELLDIPSPAGKSAATYSWVFTTLSLCKTSRLAKVSPHSQWPTLWSSSRRLAL
jgi:hypothetical protein